MLCEVFCAGLKGLFRKKCYVLTHQAFAGARFERSSVFPGVCPEATPCGRVPQENGRTVRVRPLHCQFSQGEKQNSQLYLRLRQAAVG